MIHDLKPYPAYKDSGVPWLGQVPEHWDKKRIKNLFKEKDERCGDKNETLLSLTRTRGILPQAEASNRIASTDDLSKYKLCRLGDLVMNRMQAWSGMFAMSSFQGLVSPDYSVFEATGNSNIKYFEHLFKTPIFVDQFARFSKGIGSGFNRLYTPDFGAIPVVTPTLPEQSAIVRYLDYMDRRIRRYIHAKQKLIKLLEEQKQAIIHRAVTRGLDPNVKLKPSGVEWLGDVPEGWEVVPLKGLSIVQSGITLGKPYVGKKLVEYPYLRVANVQDGHLDLVEIKTIAVPEDEAVRSMLIAGDVLMTEGGDPDKLGRGYVWEGQVSSCLHQNHVFAVRPNINRLLPYYLAAILGSKYAKDYFLRTAKQTTNLASTNKTTIGQFPVFLPSIEEQNIILQQIQAQLADILKAVSSANHQIALLREYRARLIADVVTGKLDVREAAASLPNEVEESEVLEDETLEDGDNMENELEDVSGEDEA